ncbi:MAG: biosynthetic-type acetolactate synthase large subunit [Clostridia bacterium]|nr:biosynthetic-type acetolactate synthase large subunit [Clostridia bacterium]
MLGAELLLKCLEEQGVDLVFGLPGGAVLPLYDVLRKSKIKHILTKHEQGAVHAADGYARATGKVGVCFSTSGPGATNLVTGLATARMDSSPVIAITGQAASPFLGKDSFQEADMIGLSLPVTKHSYQIRDAHDIPSIVAEAFFIATQGRPGPVLIDIPKDVFTQKVTEIKKPVIRKSLLVKFKKPQMDMKLANMAVEVLKKAKRPLILAGGGVNQVAGASELLQEFAQKNEIPVVQTLMGKGIFPAKHPLFLGMVGMHGTFKANWAVQNCDCLLAIGVRFDDRVTGSVEDFAPLAKVIHVDIDPSEHNKNRVADIPLVADCKDFLKFISEKLWASKGNKEWLRQIGLQSDLPKIDAGRSLEPEGVMELVNSLLDEDTIVVTDVGQHQMWAALYVHPSKPRSFITSGGLGTMGFGLPAAIGAQMAYPEKRVILITGDGSLQMNLQEFAVVKQWNLPIKILLINNGSLGMVRQWQELFFQKNYAESILEVGPDWIKLAEAYGIKAKTFDGFKELEDALGSTFNDREPCFLDIKVNPMANVFPMVPAGCSLDQIWGSWKNEAHASSIG